MTAGVALAFAGAQGDVDGDVGDLVGIYLACVFVEQAVVGVVAGQPCAACGQGFHAAITGVACSLGQALGTLGGTQDGVADADGQARLFEFGLGGRLAGFAGFCDFDVFGQDVDVATTNGVS